MIAAVRIKIGSICLEVLHTAPLLLFNIAADTYFICNYLFLQDKLLKIVESHYPHHLDSIPGKSVNRHRQRNALSRYAAVFKKHRVLHRIDRSAGRGSGGGCGLKQGILW